MFITQFEMSIWLMGKPDRRCRAWTRCASRIITSQISAKKRWAVSGTSVSARKMSGPTMLKALLMTLCHTK